MIEEAYVSFEVAKLLKEKGFDEPCRTFYQGGEFVDIVCTQFYQWNSRSLFGQISAPTHQMALSWLREKGFLLWVYPEVCLNAEDNRTFHWMWDGKKQRYDAQRFGDKRSYNTYGEAEEAALKYCLENLI